MIPDLRTSPPLPNPPRIPLRCRILGHRPAPFLVLNGLASFFVSRCRRCGRA